MGKTKFGWILFKLSERDKHCRGFLTVHTGKESLYGINKVSIYFIAILDTCTQLKWNHNIQVCLKEVSVNNA